MCRSTSDKVAGPSEWGLPFDSNEDRDEDDRETGTYG